METHRVLRKNDIGTSSVTCWALCNYKFISFISVSLPYDNYEWYTTCHETSNMKIQM